jgi:hypothetical protein
VIQGTLIKFTNQAEWETRDGEAAPAELVAVDISRVVQKWKGGEPVETIVLAPGEKFPDVEAMNAQIPAEWEQGPDGKPRGAWQPQHILYLLKLPELEKYTFATGTIGGRIAVRDLVDKIKWMRRYRGSGVCPIVVLSDVFMNTRFGGRQRPHFVIKGWINMDGGSAAALPVTPAPALAGPATVEPPAPVQKPASVAAALDQF